jgi:uncharacterized protein (TIGR03437 family)
MGGISMKKLLGVVCLVAAIAGTALAQPAIRAENGVVNASSYAADIARGSWFVIFGSEMGPASLAVYSGAVPYPTTLSNTSVTFTPAAGGSAVSARLWYTSAAQLAGLLPSTVAAGNYDVKVTYNSATSAAYRVKVVERNFGFATQAQNGAGPAQATYGGLDLNRFTTGTLAQWSLRPAKANDTMVLWGTGIGADANSDLDGSTSGDQTSAGQVRVVVGGIEVTPLYAGRSNGSPGLDQINFTVPGNVTPGCFVSLAVKAGGRTSNLGTIAVAEPGQAACSHPSYTQAQLNRLDQGGTLTIGALILSKTTTKMSVMGYSFDSTSESATGSFSRYGVDGVASANFSMLQIGSCFVYRRFGTADAIAYGSTPVPLDAGAQLTLNGPNATNKAVPRDATSKTYNLTLYSSGVGGIGGTGAPTLAQGTYRMAGTGGADIGAFNASLDVPGAFQWTNEGSLANPIPRSSNMNITWTGGGSGLVTITGTAMAQAGGTETNPIYDATIFSCIAQASAGSFSVPSSVLQQLPAVSSDITTGSMGSLTVMAVSDASKGQGLFTAPLTAGGSIDQGYMSYAIGTLKTTGWQ